MFWVYRAYLLGLENKILNEVRESKQLPNLVSFHNARHTLLTAVLSSELVSAQFELPLGTPTTISNLLENAMLEEMNRWIFGHGAVDLSVAQRQVLINGETVNER